MSYKQEQLIQDILGNLENIVEYKQEEIITFYEEIKIIKILLYLIAFLLFLILIT